MTPFPVVPAVLEQHVDELTELWAVRDGLCDAPHIQVRDLARFDDRIAAHQDGCVLGGADGVRVLTERLAELTAGRVFGVAVVGFALTDRRTIARCIALAEANPDARRGLTSALGWVEPAHLQGIAKSLLHGQSTVQRRLGLAACRLHGVDPAAALEAALTDTDINVRAEAARTAGVVGRADVASVLASSALDDATCQFWFAWAAVCLGNRTAALDALTQMALAPGPHRRRAFRVACQATGVTAAHEILRDLAADPAQIRWVIEGSGIVADPVYLPWLIKHMGNATTARLAGEAFTLITGADLAQSRLERTRPEAFESGPNDDPADTNVAKDPEDNLPWPDVKKVGAWWHANQHRFQKGTRYFMGQPVTREHCIDVLKNGYQRQRILAAQYLCLLEPGTPLFNTSAPAWRQQRLLAAM